MTPTDFCFFDFIHTLRPNLDKANLPTPLEPACILVLLFSSTISYFLSLFPICIQCSFISSSFIPMPLSTNCSSLFLNIIFRFSAFASYAFLTNSRIAASSVEKFCTPNNSAIVLSSITYFNSSITCTS